jgi:hypothetical protein
MVSSFDSFNLSFKNPANPVILSKKTPKNAVETTAFPITINYSTDILLFCGFLNPKLIIHTSMNTKRIHNYYKTCPTDNQIFDPITQ